MAAKVSDKKLVCLIRQNLSIQAVMCTVCDQNPWNLKRVLSNLSPSTAKGEKLQTIDKTDIVEPSQDKVG